jgi:hypothetical protein
VQALQRDGKAGVEVTTPPPAPTTAIDHHCPHCKGRKVASVEDLPPKCRAHETPTPTTTTANDPPVGGSPLGTMRWLHERLDGESDTRDSVVVMNLTKGCLRSVLASFDALRARAEAAEAQAKREGEMREKLAADVIALTVRAESAENDAEDFAKAMA